MIILDTNVLSQPSRQVPEAAVIAWLSRQRPDDLCATSINVMELLDGVMRLPQGARRRSIEAANTAVIATLAGRVHAFDEAAAAACAEVMNKARKTGFIVGLADGMIGGIASLHGCSIATQDEAPFNAMGLHVINPWTAR
ncbi:PIN domain-containing protein [Variovorax robiniae]|uniref:Ribonuclease VapC n=1 Tax=Variovorax robiniae TaxID=1836199 RepID=A0ABU8XBW4_9BURK